MQTITHDYGWYANRPRGMRRQAEPAATDAPVPMLVVPKLATHRLFLIFSVSTGSNSIKSATTPTVAA